jgi:hypothetical protein
VRPPVGEGCRSIALAAWLCLAFVTAGRAAADDSVITDRPDLTNGTLTVTPGAVQIETGVEYQHVSQAGPALHRFALQNTVRVGVAKGLEVRVDGEPFVRMRGPDDDTGTGDETLGLKYRFLDQPEAWWWPSLGVEPSLKLPTAPQPIGTGRVDVGALALVSWVFPVDLSLDVNAGLNAIGQPHPKSYLIQAVVSGSFAQQITEHFSTYVELAYKSRGSPEDRNTIVLDTGFIFLLRRWLALDAAVGTALAGRGPEYVFRTGLTVRLGR